MLLAQKMFHRLLCMENKRNFQQYERKNNWDLELLLGEVEKRLGEKVQRVLLYLTKPKVGGDPLT